MLDFPANHGPAVLRTPTCAYYDFSTIGSASLLRELAPQPPPECDFGADSPVYAERIATFDGWAWTRWTGQHWEIPLVAVAVYLLMIASLKAFMGPHKGGRPPIKATRVVLAWNFGLSAFSVAGMAFTVPLLLWGPSGVLSQGWYASVCNNAGEYGHGARVRPERGVRAGGEYASWSSGWVAEGVAHAKQPPATLCASLRHSLKFGARSLC
jgi:hypothetical protein